MFDDRNNAPFISDISVLDKSLQCMCNTMSYVYQTKGFGFFLANFFCIEKNIFLDPISSKYLKYWVSKELEIRYFAWKFYSKLKYNVLKGRVAQNSHTLDLTTSVNDVYNKVYIHSGFNFWIFTPSEIKNIILSSLNMCDITEPAPKHPCNIYTNEVLTEGQLTLIYMQIGHMKLHPYIHSYAKRYFDITRFKHYNIHELTCDSIRSHLQDMSEVYIFEISEMFESNICKILQREDIPICFKKGIIKKVINKEVINWFSPTFVLYDVYPKKRRVIRKVSRRIRSSN